VCLSGKPFTSSKVPVHIETSKPFTSKLASCSHRRRALVHIDSRERIACSTRSHRELHPVGTEKCTLSGEEGKKEKALISQDFFGLVVATGLEPVTPSM
jgi:hypothetical protein